MSEEHLKNVVGEMLDAIWQKEARSAGWAPIPKSRLRAVDCKHPPGDTCGPECSRLLTPEEVAEVAEDHPSIHIHGQTVSGIILKSGARVILVEGNDADKG